MWLDLFLAKISNLETKRYFLEKLRINIVCYDDRYRLTYIDGNMSIEKIDKIVISS
jgi:hypothetical protein